MIPRLVFALVLATSAALANINCRLVHKRIWKSKERGEMLWEKPTWSVDGFGNPVELVRSASDDEVFSTYGSKSNGELPNLAKKSPEGHISLSSIHVVAASADAVALYVTFLNRVDKNRMVEHSFVVPLVPGKDGATNVDLDNFLRNKKSENRLHMSFAWLEPLLTKVVRVDETAYGTVVVSRYLTNCMGVSADALQPYLGVSIIPGYIPPMLWEENPAMAENFENDVEFVRVLAIDHMKNEHTYFIMQTDEDQHVPSILLNGRSYRLYTVAIIPLNYHNGVVLFQVNFKNFDTARYYNDYFSFVIPLYSHRHKRTRYMKSRRLRNALFGLSHLGPGESYTGAIEWLHPLLEKAVRMHNRALVGGPIQRYDRMFLTECQEIPRDLLRSFFNPEWELEEYSDEDFTQLQLDGEGKEDEIQGQDEKEQNLLESDKQLLFEEEDTQVLLDRQGFFDGDAQGLADRKVLVDDEDQQGLVDRQLLLEDDDRQGFDRQVLMQDVDEQGLLDSQLIMEDDDQQGIGGQMQMEDDDQQGLGRQLLMEDVDEQGLLDRQLLLEYDDQQASLDRQLIMEGDDRQGFDRRFLLEDDDRQGFGRQLLMEDVDEQGLLDRQLLLDDQQGLDTQFLLDEEEADQGLLDQQLLSEEWQASQKDGLSNRPLYGDIEDIFRQQSAEGSDRDAEGEDDDELIKRQLYQETDGYDLVSGEGSAEGSGRDADGSGRDAEGEDDDQLVQHRQLDYDEQDRTMEDDDLVSTQRSDEGSDDDLEEDDEPTQKQFDYQETNRPTIAGKEDEEVEVEEDDEMVEDNDETEEEDRLEEGSDNEEEDEEEDNEDEEELDLDETEDEDEMDSDEEEFDSEEVSEEDEGSLYEESEEDEDDSEYD